MNYQLKDSILGKIMLIVAIPATLAIASSITSIALINRTIKIDEQISTQCYPLILALKDAQIYVNESYKLTGNWIYQPTNKDKERLKDLHDKRFLIVSDKINKIAQIFKDDSTKQQVTKLNASLASLNEVENTIINILDNEAAYGDDSLVDKAINQYEGPLTSVYKRTITQFERALEYQNVLLNNNDLDKKHYFQLLIIISVFSIILFIAYGLLTLSNALNNIVKPIVTLNNITSNISLGQLVDVPVSKSNDEIALMYSSVEKMVQAIRSKVVFAESIGFGKYDSSLALASEQDRMGIALIAMGNSLQKNAEEESKRRWEAEGLAKFSDLLRSDGINADKYFFDILSNLVKYVDANQGAIFILNEGQETASAFLEMRACYAYDRKKYLTKQIEIGEGMLGQVYLEKQTSYITNLPDRYTNISSGLGEATPSCLLIVPLYSKGQGVGVLEIASFTKLEPYKIAFIEKLAISIASETIGIKTFVRTKELLSKSTIQTEELLAQQEEVKQNLEELQATQDEMNRKEKEYTLKIEQLTAEVDMLKQQLMIVGQV